MRFLSFFLLLAFSCHASEVIYLKNGDRVSGAVEKLDSGKVVVKSAVFGEIKFDLAEVLRIESDKGFNVASAGANYSTHSLNLSEEWANLSISKSESASVPTHEISQMYSPEYKPVPPVEPTFWSNWATAFDAGLSAVRGNANTTNLNFGFKTARVTERDRLSVGLTSIYAQNSTSGETVTSANAIHAGARYDMNVSDRTFTFALSNFDTDQLQNLDLRAVLGGGAGFRVRQSDRAALDLFSGASFNQELFTTEPVRRTGEFITGQELRLRLSPRTEFTQRLMFFPNFTETGQYRLAFDSGAVLKLNQWLGWQTALTNTYLSDPAPGARNNDLLITTGIRVSLGSERVFKPRLKVPSFGD